MSYAEIQVLRFKKELFDRLLNSLPVEEQVRFQEVLCHGRPIEDYMLMDAIDVLYKLVEEQHNVRLNNEAGKLVGAMLAENTRRPFI